MNTPYKIWNDAIGHYFFNPQQAEQRVVFTVDDDTLWQICQNADSPLRFSSRDHAVRNFVDAVRAELCRCRAWVFHKPLKDEYPLFLGLLALQVLAVFKMGIVDSLIHNTELGAQRHAFIEYMCRPDTEGLLGAIDKVAMDTQRYPHVSLSERLAYAGLLPMFGFPTQVRLLYQEAPPKSLPPEREIDRTLDLAISQFAPGSQTVKDKQVLTAVGVVDYAWRQGRVVAVDGRGYQRRLGDCRCCGALAFRDHQPPPVQCPVCQAVAPEYRVLETWEPRGFTVEPGAEEDFDGDFEWTPRATSARLATETVPGFTPLSPKNIEYLQKEDDLLSLNSNEGEGFPFQKLTGRNIWVVPAHLQGHWTSRLAASPPAENIGLAAGKHTDIVLLRLALSPQGLALDMAGPKRVYARAAYYSWAYLLRKAACNFLDVEPAELDINLRPVMTAQGAIGEIVLFDRLENGAGYCRYLQENFDEALLRPLAPGGTLYEQLIQEKHARHCDASCYDCLRDYNNAELHPLLDWRLGLDLARLAVDSTSTLTLQDYWQLPAQYAARSLQRIMGTDTDIHTVEHMPILYVARRARAALTHPLWSSQHATLRHLASHLGPAAAPLSYCTVFDALRRPGWCESQLRG